MHSRFDDQISSTRRAFTLVELLVTIAIIAVLLSILLPALGKSRAQAQFVVCKSNLRQLTLAFTTHASDHKGAYCTGPSDNDRDRGNGAFDAKGWIADMVNGEYTVPGRLLCPTCAAQATQNIELDNLNDDPFRSFTAERQAEVFRAGYNSNYTQTWHCAMTQMANLYEESDQKNPANTLGPLKQHMIKNISPSYVVLIADARADGDDATLIDGKYYRTAKALTDGPVFDGTMWNRQDYTDLGPAHLSSGGVFNRDNHDKTHGNFGFADGHIDSFEDKNRDGKFGHTVEDGPDGPRLIYDDIEGKVFGGHIISGNRL